MDGIPAAGSKPNKRYISSVHYVISLMAQLYAQLPVRVSFALPLTGPPAADPLARLRW
jgi:hypothetical protein